MSANMAADARGRHPRRRSPSAVRLLVGAAVVATTALAGTAPANADDIASPQAGATSPEYYRVQPGDGFYSIANTLGVTTDALLARNGLTIDFVLHPGYVLLVPEGGYVPPAPPETPAPAAAETTEADAAAAGDAPSQTPAAAAERQSSTATPAASAATTTPATTAPATTSPPTTAPPTTAAPAPPPPSGVSDCRVGGIDWINNARANAGVGPVSSGNASAACSHSRRQAEAGSMFHSGSGCGEIVGYSSRSHNDLPGAWLASSGHYNIIVSPHASSAAVAYVQNLSTGYWYGTGVFC